MANTKKEMTLREKLTKIQVELKVRKGRKNNFGNYSFRSAEDIIEAVKPYLSDFGLTLIITEGLRELCGEIIIESTARLSDGVDSLFANAFVGVDMNQKGMQTPQKFGSTSSYGKKYALGNLFNIDDSQDADAINTHDKESVKLKDVNKAKLENIKSAIGENKIKKDISEINKVLNKTGFRNLTNDEFNSL